MAKSIMESQNSRTVEPGKLWTRQFAYAIATSFGLYLGYQGLIVLTPYYVSTTGSSDTTAGLVTGATMLSATTTPLVMASLLARHDVRILLLASMLLLAVPSLLNPLTTDPLVVAILHLVRGIGFGIAAVGCGTVVSILAPPMKRGAAMGWWGLTGGATTVIGPSGGLFLADVFGFNTVFLLMGILTLLTAISISRLRPMPPVATGGSASGILWAFGRQKLLLPSLIFVSVALTYGTIVTFASLYLSSASLISPAIFFFILGTVFALFRLIGGTVIDRVGAVSVFSVGLVLSSFAMMLLASTPFTGAAVAAAILYGIGFGIIATAALVTLVSRVSREGYGTANSLFVLAFNGGIGFGGVLFGVVAQAVGYASMFLSTMLCFAVAGILLYVDQSNR